MTTDKINSLLQRAKTLKLYGVISHWDEVHDQPWLNDLIAWEEAARSQRSLERRLRSSRVGRFKPLSEFDWHWPKSCDREAIEECMLY